MKSVPFASTAVIVTTAPMLNVGKIIVMLDGDVAITAVAGVVPAFDDESMYGAKPPLMVYTTLDELQDVLGTAGIAAKPENPPLKVGGMQAFKDGL